MKRILLALMLTLLTYGHVSAQMSDEEFNAKLAESVQQVYEASIQ